MGSRILKSDGFQVLMEDSLFGSPSTDVPGVIGLRYAHGNIEGFMPMRSCEEDAIGLELILI